jgi:methyltransferase family protein
MNEDAKRPTPEHFLQTGLAFWPSKILLSAIEMEACTLIAQHPGTLEELQGRLGLHPRAARDFLDTLVALGFLQRTDGKYLNTPATEAFLDKRSRRTSPAFSRWPTCGCIVSGAT